MGSDPLQTIFQLNAAEQVRREAAEPAPSSVSWHPCHHGMAGVVNNPLHFRGELSALKGCEWKNIKGKHSASVQKSGPRQGIWAHALSCLAHAGKGDARLSMLGGSVVGPNGGIWEGPSQEELRAAAVEVQGGCVRPLPWAASRPLALVLTRTSRSPDIVGTEEQASD